MRLGIFSLGEMRWQWNCDAYVGPFDKLRDPNIFLLIIDKPVPEPVE